MLQLLATAATTRATISYKFFWRANSYLLHILTYTFTSYFIEFGSINGDYRENLGYETERPIK